MDPAEPGGHQPRRRVGLARCAARAGDCAYASRRPPAARRRSRRARAPVSGAGAPPYEQAHVRLDAGRASVDALVEQLVRLAARRSRIAARLLIHDALPRPHRHSREPRSAGRLPGRRRVAGLRPRRSCSAISSATAPIRTPSSSACRRSTPVAHGPRQPRQGGLRPRTAGRLQRRRRSAPRTGRYDDADAGQPRSGSRRCRKARSSSTTLVEICHGSPFDEDAYIFDELDAVRALKTSQRPLCLFGHTHWPVDVRAGRRARRHDRRRRIAGGRADRCRPESKYLINPGSVGQPRDGDPRAAYAIVDTAAKRSSCIRVDYPIETTQAKVIEGRAA